MNGTFFLPTYGTVLAAVSLDQTGTTRIGKFVVNHSFMRPGRRERDSIDAHRARARLSLHLARYPMTLRSSVALALLAGSRRLAHAQEFRTEKDLLGEKNVPAGAYYGVQTARALENFRISGSDDRRLPRFHRRRWRS